MSIYSKFLSENLMILPKRYVVGFLFQNSGKEVALIAKLRPEWQKGMLNGVGGKIKSEEESPAQAINREFKEETGADIQDWRLFCILSDIREFSWKVFMYSAHTNNVNIKTCEDEEVAWYQVKDIPTLNTVPNLRWLIPMALDQNDIIADVAESLCFLKQ
jgi:8-oxo-dGTP diphosphatase